MSDKRFEAVVVGNAGVDTNVYAPGRDVDFSLESSFTDNVDCVGQAGGYAARGFARLKKRSAFIGYVGDDANGRWIRDTFAADGVDTTALFVDPAGTSRSVNFMYADGRRKNFYDGKSHMRLAPDLDRCRQVLAQARLAHFNLPNWARLLLPIARQHGAVVSCDLQDVVSLDDPYRQDFIRCADILFLSAANHLRPTALVESLLQSRPNLIVVMGMGERGCALGAAGRVRFFDPLPLPEPVVDTNGAGDSLAVGFLSGYLLEGHSLEDSVLRGQIAARHKCAQKASSSTLITAELLEQYYAAAKAG